MYISPPNFIRRIFPSLIWTMPETDRVYLTFDDGPTPGVTAVSYTHLTLPTILLV